MTKGWTGIRNECLKRGITRICHFTPSRNFVHMAASGVGILSTRKLKEEERCMYTPTDLLRLDGQEGFVCCSIEYPNSWYFAKARAKETLFADWVILFIDPKYLWMPGTKFCPRNASKGRGRYVLEGEEAFGELFSDIISIGGRTIVRAPQHLPCCPTDDQAEVLIPDRIPLQDVIGVAVSSEEQAKKEIVRLQLARLESGLFRWVIAPVLYDKYALSTAIRSGTRPVEIPWT